MANFIFWLALGVLVTLIIEMLYFRFSNKAGKTTGQIAAFVRKSHTEDCGDDDLVWTNFITFRACKGKDWDDKAFDAFKKKNAKRVKVRKDDDEDDSDE